eukprot:9583607-Ditylum_brightwellii.AAC.1
MNSQLHSQLDRLTTANATMQASLNAIEQQMAFMAVIPIPATQPTQHPPPQQQPQQPHMYGGRGNYGGRGRYYGGRNNPYNGRRGRGGRGRSYQSNYNQGRQQVPGFVPTPPTFQYNQQPPATQGNFTQPQGIHMSNTQQQQIPQVGANTPFQLNNQNQLNPYKRFNNYNHCWSHGFDIPDNHTSQSCPYPKAGHNWYATGMNTMGGSQS